MITIKDRKDCCGCSACASGCPKKCITMVADAQGFSYPFVDASKCVDCGICESICPVLNLYPERLPLEVKAAWNKDEDKRRFSSSGGIFVLLAERILEEQGVVFGAKLDKRRNVCHSWTETKEGLCAFLGSKYVQSCIGDSYSEAESFLKKGRKVLFSGTPCQIAGLRHFLRKEYDGLLCVEVICHGAPSPAVWNAYLDSLPCGRDKMDEISFRDKGLGWEKFSLVIKDNDSDVVREDLNVNKYLRLFLNDLILRPSCFDCPSRKGRSGADLSLGDFWRVKEFVPECSDDKGTSLVLAYSKKGASALEDLKMESRTSDYRAALVSNFCIEKSVAKPEKYDDFWKAFPEKGIDNGLKFCRKASLSDKIVAIAVCVKNKIFARQ